MAAPWEKYQAAPSDGPWSKYSGKGKLDLGQGKAAGQVNYDLAGRAANAAQGLAFGWGDELAGANAAGATSQMNSDNIISQGIQDLFSGNASGPVPQADPKKAYFDAQGAFRDTREKFAADHPVEAMGLNIAGSLPTLALGLPARAATVGANMLRTGKVAAAVGGVTGAGEADGDLGDRIWGGVKGGAIGFGAGSLLEGTAPFAKKALDNLLSVMLPAKAAGAAVPAATDWVGARAAKVAGKALERDRTTPVALSDLATLNAGSGKPLALADLGGENVKMALDSAVNRPGEARNAVRDFLTGRQTGKAGPLGAPQDVGLSQQERLAGDVKAHVSDASFTDAIDALTKQRADAAAPLYEKAYADAGAGLRSPTIDVYLKTPAGRKALDNAVTIAQNEVGWADSDVARTLTGLKDGSYAGPIPMRVLDLVKRSMGDVVKADANALTGKIETEAGRSTQGVLNGFRNELVKLNPAYGDALASYSGPSHAIDLIQKGKDWMAKSIAPDAVKKEFSALSGDDQQLTLIGVAKHLTDKIEATPQVTHNAAARVLTGSDMQKLSPLLGKDRLTALMNQIDREKAMFETQGVLTNSKTAMRGAAADDMDSQALGAFVEGASRGKPTAGLIAMGMQWLKDKASGLGSEQVRTRLADWLTTTDPLRQQAALKEIADRMTKLKASEGQGLGVKALPFTQQGVEVSQPRSPYQ